MSFVEKVEQLNQEIGASFDRAFSSLRRELQDRLRESHQELDRKLEAFSPAAPRVAHEDLAPAAAMLSGEARGSAFGELRDAFAALDRARSQAAVLEALIAGAGRFASRAAVLLVRGAELRGWGGHGFEDSEHALRDLVLTPPAGTPWSQLAGGTPAVPAAAAAPEATTAAAGAVQLSAVDCAVLCGRIESPVPALGFLVPLVLRDRVAALLYADPSASRQPAPPDQAAAVLLPALQSLVYVAALAIESLPFRQRSATATLTVLGEPAAPFGEPAVPAAAGAAANDAAAIGEPQGIAGSGAGSAPGPAHETYLPREATASVPPREAVASLETAPAAATMEQPRPAPAGAAGAGAGAGELHLAPPPTPTDDDEAEVPAEAAHGAGPVLPFTVTPATLYDAPSVPLAQETAELPTPRPLRPARATVETNSLSHGPSPYLEEPAESSGHPAAGPAGGGPVDAPAADNETVLLPQAGVRDLDASPGSGPAPLGRDRAAAGEPWAPRAADAATAGPAAGSAGSGGLGTLRAVPPIGSASGPQPLAPEPLEPPQPPPPPIPFTPPASATGAFEPLRTGPISSGTPEVRPPTGVQGPGWAFAATRQPAGFSDEAVHEEARRLARLLVSEIKLYNEEQVEAGRRNRDIYERLREDIDRSRQMYEERVDPHLVKSTDYFYQELVRILAAGDSKAMGI